MHVVVTGPPNAGKSSLVNLLSMWDLGTHKAQLLDRGCSLKVGAFTSTLLSFTLSLPFRPETCVHRVPRVRHYP